LFLACITIKNRFSVPLPLERGFKGLASQHGTSDPLDSTVVLIYRIIWKPGPPAEATHATRSDMTEAAPAMRPPHAHALAAQALGSSSGRYVRRKVSSFSGTGKPSHIA
jgi:hypothetical protein